MTTVSARASATRLLVLQATQFCNIDCRYCYVPNRTRRGHITAEVLAAVRRQIIEANRLERGGLVLWHAGEPLAIGVPRFITLRQSLFGDRRPEWIREQVQTNATLIDSTWAGYLRSEAIMVGVSLAGPAWIHDKRRVNRAGRGTHGAVLRGMSELERAGVDFSIICVVGEDTLDNAQEVFEFLRDLGPKAIGFSVEKIEGANRESSLDADRHFERVRGFFRTVTRANVASPNPVVVREIEQALVGLPAGATDRSPSDEATLGRIVSISLDGEVGFLSPEMITNPAHPIYGEYTFGSLLHEDLAEIEARAARSRLLADVSTGVEECRSKCEFWRFCGGGSPSAKISEAGSAATTRTSFCVLAKQAAVLGILDAVVEDQCLVA